ncbi:MAG TPA: SAM-dependent methyltransferase [Candidatus Acidoferrum sp.]|nr:SAM-dependent methyltransferase [Candidatus Acidoferrum sp.]
MAMKGPTMKGKVCFMGVSSGDAELLSGEAVRVLHAAEVVLHDTEVPQAILDLTPAWTQVRNVGNSAAGSGLSREKIHALLIGAAREGHQVVRLKSGDLPLTESASDELEALEQAGVEFIVISGAAAIGTAAGTRSR